MLMEDTASHLEPENLHLSEVALVARAQDGDVGAFTGLVREYQDEVVRLSFRLLSDRHEAEDVVQEVLITMWRQLPQLSDPQAFRAWIYKITTRRCLNALRQKSRQRVDAMSGPELEEATHASAVTVNSETDPAQVVQAKTIGSSLEQALTELPTDLRVCWVLNQLHDLTYPQIAESVGAPVSTVRGRISRARRILARGMLAWQ